MKKQLPFMRTSTQELFGENSSLISRLSYKSTKRIEDYCIVFFEVEYRDQLEPLRRLCLIDKIEEEATLGSCKRMGGNTVGIHESAGCESAT